MLVAWIISGLLENYYGARIGVSHTISHAYLTSRGINCRLHQSIKLSLTVQALSQPLSGSFDRVANPQTGDFLRITNCFKQLQVTDSSCCGNYILTGSC